MRNKTLSVRSPICYVFSTYHLVVFQQIDVEECTESGSAPTLRMFGVTEVRFISLSPVIMFKVMQAGNSVLMHVKGFLPYFYVASPRGFMPDDCPSLKDYLNRMDSGGIVRAIEVQKKRSLWGYRGDDWIPFIKVTVADQRSLPKIRGLFERGECQFNELFKTEGTRTFESNIGYTLRFMIDTNVVGMNWIEVPKGKYVILKEGKKSHCQLEIEVRWDQFISHVPEGEWSKIAPVRILSFDIECAGRKGIFPEANIDPVIQIANMVTCQGA
jgi:DNA polymerase delta subunit 1